MITPSEAVRLLLVERHVTPTALAKALDVSVQQGSQLLSGVRTIQMAHVSAIAELLEVAPYQLFTHRDLLGHSSGPEFGLTEELHRASHADLARVRATIADLQRKLHAHLTDMFELLHELDKTVAVPGKKPNHTPRRASR